MGSADGRPTLLVGSGFFITRDGHVMTNANVTYMADRIWVEHRGIPYAAELIGGDPFSNISIVRLLTRPENIRFIHLGNQDEMPTIASLVLAITCELGMEPRPSFGMVTGRNTSYGERILPTVYLRTDIPSDGGEGGSPVFDMSGNFIGVMVASLPEIRSSFVLPARAARRVRDDILFSGEVTYGWFGLQTRELADLEHGTRVVIEKVFPASPAAGSGLRPGDVLLRVGDNMIRNDDDLRMATFFIRANQDITVRVRRDETEYELPMRVGKRVTDPYMLPTSNDDVSEAGENGISPAAEAAQPAEATLPSP